MTARSGVEIDDAVEALYRAYSEPLLNYLYRLLGNRGEAEEAMQDTFVKAYGALGSLPDGANRRAWLYRIASNTAKDRLRRRRLIQWLPLRETDPASTALDRPEATAADRTDVARALARLAPGYRQALWLYSVDGYDTAEIATILGSAARRRKSG